MWQNEFLFKKTAISTSFGAICCKMACVLVQNRVRFGAKQRAFWCKMKCVLVQNGVCFGAKRKAKWCKTQCEMLLNAR